METQEWRNQWRGWVLGCLAVLLFAWVLVQPSIRPQRQLTARENSQVAEAQAWWNGKLYLPERTLDTALVDGRAYNVFPPMFTLIAAVFGPICWGIPQPFLVFAILLPIVVLAYAVCYQQTRSAPWAALLAIGFIAGTSAVKVLGTMTRAHTPYFINHALAMLGLLLLLADYFGRRRIWVGCIGLLIAAWSRQLTIVFAIPLLYAAMKKAPGRPRRCAIATVCFTGVVITALPLTLNALKFGNPLDSGYSYIYNDQPPSEISRNASDYGLFAPHFVPRNLYYSFLGLPKLDRVTADAKTELRLTPNYYGTGIWWTTPLLLFLFVDARKLWRDPQTRVLLVSVLGVFSALLFYHNTGWSQRGINRFSLDYLPVLYMMLLPRCLSGNRKWVAMGMVVWSLLYFGLILPERYIRIG